MPKKILDQKPGTRVDSVLGEILKLFFKAEELKRLEAKGGRIVISITSPIPTKADKELVIDNKFIEKLKDSAKNADKIIELLSNLSVKQLAIVCKELRIPVKNKQTRGDSQDAIIQFIRSTDVWKSMIG